MAITLKTNKQGLAIIDEARGKKNWSALAAAWCEKANVSVSTLKRFRERKSIQKDAFVAICEAVGIENWELVAANPAYEASTIRHQNQRSQQRLAQEVLSKLSHLDVQLELVEQPFSAQSEEGQLQVIHHYITPALVEEIGESYSQLTQAHLSHNLSLEKQSPSVRYRLTHPLTIEATVSIIQITVSA